MTRDGHITMADLGADQLLIGKTVSLNLIDRTFALTGVIQHRTADFIFIKIGDLEVVVPLTAISFMALHTI